MFEFKDASNQYDLMDRVCPFCESESVTRCDDDCVGHQPAFKKLIAEIRELLLATEYLYKKAAPDFGMEERLRLEETINQVVVSVRGL